MSPQFYVTITKFQETLISLEADIKKQVRFYLVMFIELKKLTLSLLYIND